ncbi:MAG: ATP synthase F1 subunit delta [Ignavibacteria bacterium 13_1_40CM_2_61_4]|nr:MAG: ATP synthase F1 subunit delta [Ignavibacteria bacterium 13_1_40CM_2_61_4]
MSGSRAARRYALALMTVAEEQKKVEEVDRDCLALERLISESRDFSLFLQSPVIKTLRKRQILGELFKGRIGETALRFVVFLAMRGREDLLASIIQEFFRLRDERAGVVNVTASAAVPFTPAQEKRLMSRLEEATKKKVRVKYVLERSLKGGFIVQLGDTVWDASVRHQLEIVYRRLAGEAA